MNSSTDMVMEKPATKDAAMTSSSDKPSNKIVENMGKFLFDLSFDSQSESAAASTITLSMDELAATKAASYQEGAVAGKREAEQTHELKVAAQLERVAIEINALVRQFDKISEMNRHVSINAIKAIAHNLLPGYVKQHGFAEIEYLVGQCLADLKDEPRLLIRVAPSMLDVSVKRFEQMAAQTAFPGKLIILADKSLEASDCRVEWADGGVERSVDAMWKQVEASLGRAAAASNRTAQQARQETDTITDGENNG